MDRNCSFVPNYVHFVLKKQKSCTFYSKNGVFAKKFHWNVHILDKKCSFVPKTKRNCTFYAKNEVFEKKNSLKCTNSG